MKSIRLTLVLSATLLTACASVPVISTSYGGMRYAGPPTSLDDTRLRHPTYYRDEDDDMPWLRYDSPRSNR